MLVVDGDKSEYGFEFARTKANHIHSLSDLKSRIPTSLADKISLFVADGLILEYMSKSELASLRSSSSYINFITSFNEEAVTKGRQWTKIGVSPSQILLLNDTGESSSSGASKEAASNEDKGFFNKSFNIGKPVDKVEAHELEKEETRRRFYPYIQRGIEEKGSDVHFELRKKDSYVKIRIYGDLVVVDRMSYDQMLGMLNACYNTLQDDNSNSDSSLNPDVDSYCTITIPSLSCKLRWQTVPTGRDREFDVVIRIAPQSSSELMTLDKIGFTQNQGEMLTLLASKPSGLVVIAGVTGSGKTTTLQTLMSLAVGTGERKLYSIEDPIERIMAGVTQMQIQGSGAFAPAIKVLMRADPDVIMIGEIRDKETAESAIDATRTGHLVFSTTHTNSAFGIAGRLMSPSMGIEPSTLSEYGIVSAFIYQKLVPLLCPHCKKPYMEHKDLMPPETAYQLFDEHRYSLPEDNVSFKGDGCSHCKKGIIGMTVCAEMVNPTNDLLKFIHQNNLTEARHRWRESRISPFHKSESTGKTAVEVGMSKVAAGLIDPLRLQLEFGAFELEDIVRNI